MIDNPLCLLAIEERPNSFMPIDLKELGLGVPSTSMTLKELDQLLFLYSAKFIREQIKINNVIPDYAFELPLVILYEDESEHKRKLPIIPEEFYFQGNIREILFENIENKKFINQVTNKIKLLPVADQLKNELLYLLKNGFVEEFVLNYNKLPYFVHRNLFLQLNNIVRRQNKRVREKNIEEVE